MPRQFSVLSIGGVDFAVHASLSAELRPAESSRYDPFLDPSQSCPGAFGVSVDLRKGEPQVPQEMRCIFESGEAWKMFASGGRRCAVLHPPRCSLPLWSAEFDAGFVESVSVCCSDGLKMDSEIHGGPLASSLAYPLDFILVMYALSHRSGMIVHCAGMDLGGDGYLFCGRSGTGKSTVSRRLLQHGGITCLSDDRIVVRKIDDEFRMFGTPWLGEEDLGINRHAPCRALFFLKHGPPEAVVRLATADAMDRLLPLVSVPWYDASVLPMVLDSCESLLKGIPSFELSLTLDSDIQGIVRLAIGATA